jgi:hypothetical protein
VEVVAQCFATAELEVRDIVASTRPNANEEAITNDLELQLAKSLRVASANREIESAFVEDLRNAYPMVDSDQFQETASGLVAQVSWQERSTEARTGGDFGIVLARPVVNFGDTSFSIAPGHRRGILVQAKKGHVDGRWGRLKQNQEGLFPSFRPHGVLLLYPFANTHALMEFKWLPCRRRQLSTIKTWLKKGTFPPGLDSAELINELGRGQLGTSDQDVITDRIAPGSERTLVIRIDWSIHRPPRSEVAVIANTVEHQFVGIHH